MSKVFLASIAFLSLLLNSNSAFSNCTISGTPNNSSGNPLSACTGIVTVTGTLTINSNYNVSALAITALVVAPTGTINWTGNFDFRLPAGASIVIQSGGQLTTNPCNSQRTLTVGTITVASCNGNGANFSFAQLMSNGSYGNVPNITANSNSPVCQNTSLQLTSTPSGGTTPYSYSWTGPGGYSSTSQSPAVSNPAGGTYTVVVTDAIGLTKSASTSVTVNPLPAAPSAIHNSRCGSGTVTISATPPAGSTIDWYSTPTLGSAISTGSTSYTTPVISSNNTYYAESRNTTTGCVSSTRTAVTATVNTVPTATIAYTASTFCSTSGSQTVTITGQSGGSFSSTAGLNINTGSGAILPSSSLAGTYVVTYTFSNGLCSNSTTTSVTIEATPSATISYAQSTYCTSISTPQSVILTGTGGGTFGSTAGLSINSGNGNITPSLSTPGLYTVTYTTPAGTACTATQATTQVTIVIGTLVNAGSDGEVCFNSSYALSGSISPAGTTNWLSSGNGVFGNASQLATTYTPGSTDSINGSVWLILETVSGCYSRDSLLLTINKIPSIPVITAPRVVCAGNSGAISVAPIANADSYIWWVQSPGTLASATGQTNTINVPTNLGTGISGLYISSRASNECGVSDSSRFWIRSYISAPTLGGPTSVCAGSSYTYTSRVINDADSVRWTLPPNVTVTQIDSVTYTISYGPAFTGGSITINAYFICQNTSITRNIILVPTRTPAAISGLSTSLCDTTITYSVPPVQDAISYEWTVPAGVTVTGPTNTNSITLTFGSFTTGTLGVKSFNPCNVAGSVRTLAIKGAPATPASISGPSSVCAQQTGLNYTTPAVVGALSYQWTVPNTASILSGQGTTSVMIKWGSASGSLSVKANRTCAGYGSAKSFAVAVTCREGMNLSENSFTLSPNPTRNNFTVTIRGLNDGSKVSYAISDLSGRQLNVINTIAQEVTIQNIETTLPQGIYILTVESDGYRKVTKFVIE